MPLPTFQPCQVSVAGGRAYTYKLPDTIDATVGDQVVVDFGTKGLTVGTIESVNLVPLDPAATFRYKWVVQAVDRSAYNNILREEAGLEPL